MSTGCQHSIIVHSCRSATFLLQRGYHRYSSSDVDNTIQIDGIQRSANALPVSQHTWLIITNSIQAHWYQQLFSDCPPQSSLAVVHRCQHRLQHTCGVDSSQRLGGSVAWQVEKSRY